jgi:hypothetical protein
MPITTTPSNGPQGEFSTYTPISSQTLSSNTSSITFSNIPTTFTDLVLVCSARSAWTSDEYEAVGFRFNGDSSTNYSTTFIAGNGSSAASFRESSQPQITARMNPSTSSNTAFSSIIVQIQNYSNVTTNKTVLIRSNSSVEFYEVAANVGTWRSTSPITSLFVGNARANLVAGSTFTLYGIKAAAPAPKATGGSITTDGSFWYHAFRETGLFEPTQAITADILVVAGGGPGGAYAGGGGGAGGVLGFASQSLTANTKYSCVVGAGGGGALNGSPGIKGNDSRFGALTLVKGGGFGKNGGGVLFSEYENSGGSSGGGGGSSNGGQRTPQAGTAGQGNSGGTASTTDSAGGGGAGAVGGGAAGTGGAGATFNTTIGGSSGPFSFINPMGVATGIGQLSGGNWFFGGGGGAAYTSNISGGVGGGGAGAAYNEQGNVTSRGTDGMMNTGGGGGGGGASNNDSTTRAMSGGSGVIIVRYPV